MKKSAGGGSTATPPSRIHKYALAALVAIIAVVGVGASQFEKLPVPVKKMISGHVRAAQEELSTARTNLNLSEVVIQEQLASFTTLVDNHGEHYRRDFSTTDSLFIETTKESLERDLAREEAGALRGQLSDSTVSNRDVLQEFRHVDGEHASLLAADDIRFIDSIVRLLEPLVQTFDDLQGASDTVPMTAEVALWREYLNLPRPRAQAPADSVARARITEIETAISQRASVTTPANIKTCRDISNRNCAGETSSFTQREVNFWARVNVPRSSETLSLQWTDAAGNVEETYPFQVTQSAGYRVYRGRTYQEPGTYEARLYNGRDQLIGRKVFTVR